MTQVCLCFVARSFTVGFIASGNWARCGCDGSSPIDTDVCFDQCRGCQTQMSRWWALMSSGTWRIVTRYGMRGQRIGEAKNPGSGSQRRRTQRLLCNELWIVTVRAMWNLRKVGHFQVWRRRMWRPVCQSANGARMSCGPGWAHSRPWSTVMKTGLSWLFRTLFILQAHSFCLMMASESAGHRRTCDGSGRTRGHLNPPDLTMLGGPQNFNPVRNRQGV